MVTIIDYGVGNLFSLASSFAYIGEQAVITSDPSKLESAERLILPGVGAFEDAIFKLKNSGLDQILVKKVKAGTPTMGICLGMQLLFDKSFEYGEHDGLGLISGEIVPISGVIEAATSQKCTLKIPQMGWNSLNFNKSRSIHPIFKYITDGDFTYFVHSFCAVNCQKSVIASVEYGAPIVAAVASNEYPNLCACQFHPEKSGTVGLNILRGFREL